MNKIDRRTFVTGSAMAAATCVLPLNAVQAQQRMRTRVIPGTDERLPIMGLGGSDSFIKLPVEGKELPHALINAFAEHGGRLVDTMPFFRPDPPIIGELLSDLNLQSDFFLTSKVTVDGKDQGIDHLERAVANLGKHPMDLLMVHNMRDMHFHWPTLKDMKEAGKVRYTGVSLGRPGESAYNNYATFHALESFMKKEKPDFIMIPYSIHHPQTAERILPLALDIGTAVIGIEAFKTGDDGGLFGLVAGKELPDWAAEFDCESWAQFSLKFIQSHPAMTCIVTETNKVRHVIDNARAGYGRLPDKAMQKKMSEYLLAL